ncbi:uncharacterized protein G2W53_033763 [Senna tora]|uniref:Uncharacterized protein n=1 Tax=Senna tora TaxID=362788 RepID=A0A834T0Q3_9FABA|nr:uncharacterized protein G2W53_033763 [Senna tora]
MTEAFIQHLFSSLSRVRLRAFLTFQLAFSISRHTLLAREGRGPFLSTVSSAKRTGERSFRPSFPAPNPATERDLTLQKLKQSASSFAMAVVSDFSSSSSSSPVASFASLSSSAILLAISSQSKMCSLFSSSSQSTSVKLDKSNFLLWGSVVLSLMKATS